MTLFLMTISAQAQASCSDVRDFIPAFRVNLVVDDPLFDLTRKSKFILKNRDRIAGLKALPQEQKFWSQMGTPYGLTRSGFSTGTQSVINDVQYGGKASDFFCTLFSEVSIDIKYNPSIYIGREYPEGTCEFKVIMGQQLGYFDANRAVAEKYAAKLQADIPLIVAELEKGGYVESAALEPRKVSLRQALDDAVAVYTSDMYQEMEAVSAKFDKTAYQAEFDACKPKRK